MSLGSGFTIRTAEAATAGWQDTAASLYWGTMWGSEHEARQLESSLDPHSLCPLLSPVTIDGMTAFPVPLPPVDLGSWWERKTLKVERDRVERHSPAHNKSQKSQRAAVSGGAGSERKMNSSPAQGAWEKGAPG